MAGDFSQHSLVEIGAMIAARQVSPVEVAEGQLARIEAFEPRLHAFVRVTADRAIADARRTEGEIMAGRSRGPLHGVPIGLKDLIDTAGIATEAGTKVMAGRVPARDATVAARLAEAGTVLLGKLAMTEGAFSEHRPEREEPRNPWSRDHWTGVSSSGSGVAVAAGLAFGALGSDTGGSIRFPSSACGITGLKPGWGRVSRAGVFPLAPSLDHVGPMARSAADCAALFDVIAGADPADPTSLDPPPSSRTAEAKTIGVDRPILASIDPQIAAVLEQALDSFVALGLKVREISLPPLEPFARGWAATTSVEAALAHKEMFDAAPEEYGPAMATIIGLGRSLPATDYAALHLARLEFVGAMALLHRDVDMALVPALPMPTPTLAMLAMGGNDPEVVAAMLRFTAAFNYSGQPCLTLPGGFDKAGMPIGFQLVGPQFSEVRLLRAGTAFQQATDWHRMPPLEEPARR
jgi:amidase